MNRLPLAKRAQIAGMLLEGLSMRATSRLADVSINTVTKLLVDLGAACAVYQDKALRVLPCKYVQCDELWAFCYAKKKNVPKELKGTLGYGDIWTWTALCSDTKLLCSWLVGRRNATAAREFMLDLSSRMAGRIQLTSDALRHYAVAVQLTFGTAVDYGILIKVYGEDDEQASRRYSPSAFVGATRHKIIGNPDLERISTSHVERNNLTIRMGCRRYTRLTNAFSKKAENHAYAFAMHAMFYNFGRIHRTLRVTPAMEAGVSDHVWSLEEIAALSP